MHLYDVGSVGGVIICLDSEICEKRAVLPLCLMSGHFHQNRRLADRHQHPHPTDTTEPTRSKIMVRVAPSTKKQRSSKQLIQLTAVASVVLMAIVSVWLFASSLSSRTETTKTRASLLKGMREGAGATPAKASQDGHVKK
jgi:hypothetical protein